MHFRSCAVALLVAVAGSIGIAQKITTPEELDKVMKRVQQANMAANKALAAKNLDEAAKQLAVVKQAINDSREFWIQHKKDDAIAANKDVVCQARGGREAADRSESRPGSHRRGDEAGSRPRLPQLP